MATARISLSPAPDTGPLQQSHLPWWQLKELKQSSNMSNTTLYYVLTTFTLKTATVELDSWWDIVWKPRGGDKQWQSCPWVEGHYTCTISHTSSFFVLHRLECWSKWVTCNRQAWWKDVCLTLTIKKKTLVACSMQMMHPYTASKGRLRVGMRLQALEWPLQLSSWQIKRIRSFQSQVGSKLRTLC